MAATISSNGSKTFNGPSLSPAKLWEYKFMQSLNQKHQLKLQNYDDMLKWSIDNAAAFWEDVWHETGIKASTPFDTVIRPYYLCNNSTKNG